MPRPIPVRIVLQVLQQKGFFFVSQTGSHAKYRKIGSPTLNVIVPIHSKEIPYRTFKSILRQSRVNEEDFYKNS